MHEEKTKEALSKIRSLYKTIEGKDSVTTFVSHHLDELTQEEWQQCLGVPEPNPADILNALSLRSAWSAEDNDVLDVFDFSPNNYKTN